MTAPGALARVVVVGTSPGVPAGTLTWPAWEVLRSGTVLAPAGPQARAVMAAGVPVEVVDPGDPGAVAAALRSRARAGVPAVWLAGPDGDPAVVGALAADGGAAVETVVGAAEPPGARLLEAVAVMDRLRSPGGCPWDAQQTHASLAPYLVEETYEALQALEDGDLPALRDELGDVLLQVLFHARLAEELPPGQQWSVDDVAAGLVAKLVRRHPHVFGDVEVTGVAQVEANWDSIKAREGRESLVAGVALGQPALTLAAKLQRRARKGGVSLEAVSDHLASAETVAVALAAQASALVDDDVPPTVDRVGDLLNTAVTVALGAGVDPEAALRGTARRFRERLLAAEALARESGRDPATLAEGDWAALLTRVGAGSEAGAQPAAGSADPAGTASPVAPGTLAVDDEGVPVGLDADGVPADFPDEP